MNITWICMMFLKSFNDKGSWTHKAMPIKISWIQHDTVWLYPGRKYMYIQSLVMIIQLTFFTCLLWVAHYKSCWDRVVKRISKVLLLSLFSKSWWSLVGLLPCFCSKGLGAIISKPRPFCWGIHQYFKKWTVNYK